jgi:hypothetical protein
MFNVGRFDPNAIDRPTSKKIKNNGKKAKKKKPKRKRDDDDDDEAQVPLSAEKKRTSMRVIAPEQFRSKHGRTKPWMISMWIHTYWTLQT